MELPKDVVNRVQADFGSSSDEALKLLREAVFMMKLTHPRVMRCVVYLSKGQVFKLTDMIDEAVADYKNVIFWAEFEDRDTKKPRHVRNFEKPFGKES